MNTRNPRNTPKRVTAVPIHRGPQAAGPAAHGAPPGGFHHAPNAALLIDFDNVTTGIRSDLGNELRSLLSSDIIKGKVAVQRAYADWRRYPQHMVPLAEASIDTIQATAYGTSKKNATDIRLAVDAIELVFTRPEIGTYILLSGDSDFSSLVLKLKEYGKYVIGVGIRESSSDLLVMNCDEYYSYNALTGLMRSGDEPAPKHDPWELVNEAVTRMKRNGDVMRSDRLKQVMQEIDNSFDEKDLGYSKFSRFCQEAVTRGVLSVTKLDNGQLEVDLPRAREAAVEAPPRRAEPEPARTRPPAREPEAEDDERARRGRHGRRRGRDRGRGERPERTDQVAPEPQTVDAEVIDISDLPAVPPVAAEGEVAAADGRRTPDRGRDSGPQRVVADTIGVSGERLSRDEALALVRAAVASLTTGTEDVARASDVRIRGRELLGRDSETLAERHFGRILRDAHDANVIDLRRRGDDFEVARAAEAAPVGEQLSRSEPAAPAAPAQPPSPRGMGHRGGGARGRSSFGGGRVLVPPPDLLSFGVVDLGVEPAPTPAPAASPDVPPPLEAMPAEEPVFEAPEEEAAPAPRARRGKTPVRVRAVKKASPTPAESPAVKKKPRRSGARKSATEDE